MSEENQLDIKLPDKPFLRPIQVAKILDLDINTVYNMIDEGEIFAKKVRRQWRIPTNIFRDYLKRTFQKSFSSIPP